MKWKEQVSGERQVSGTAVFQRSRGYKGRNYYRKAWINIENYDQGLKLLYKFIFSIFPAVDRELDSLLTRCSGMVDAVLKLQAVSSINTKKFHAQGGCAYVLYPGAEFENTVKFIVSLQTISDYLDNLCDRAGVTDEHAFRQLHAAMTDAVSLAPAAGNYYRCYPYKSDGGYLEGLVSECRSRTKNLPAYHMVEETVVKYARLYSDLQVYKHLGYGLREARLMKWADTRLKGFPGLYWWELSAAAGSTLGIFLLFAAAHNASLTKWEVRSMDEAYFPWVCGLHILLDYFIDGSEDIEGGDLNFTACYSGNNQCVERLSLFSVKSFEKCGTLAYPGFHFTIISGLLAMYLSDSKAYAAERRAAGRRLLKSGGKRAYAYYLICRILRHAGRM